MLKRSGGPLRNLLREEAPAGVPPTNAPGLAENSEQALYEVQAHNGDCRRAGTPNLVASSAGPCWLSTSIPRLAIQWVLEPKCSCSFAVIEEGVKYLKGVNPTRDMKHGFPMTLMLILKAEEQSCCCQPLAT